MAQRRTSARPACGLKQSLEFLNKSGQSTGSEWDSPEEPGCRYTSKAPALARGPLVNKDPPPLCCWPVLQMWTESLPSPCPAGVHLPEVDTEVPTPLGQPRATQMPVTILNTPSLSPTPTHSAKWVRPCPGTPILPPQPPALRQGPSQPLRTTGWTCPGPDHLRAPFPICGPTRELVPSGNAQLRHLTRSPNLPCPQPLRTCANTSYTKRNRHSVRVPICPPHGHWLRTGMRHDPSVPRALRLPRKVERAEASADHPGGKPLTCSPPLQPHCPIAECLLQTQLLPTALLSQVPLLALLGRWSEHRHHPPLHHSPALPPRGPTPCPLGAACGTAPMLPLAPHASRPTDL